MKERERKKDGDATDSSLFFPDETLFLRGPRVDIRYDGIEMNAL